MPLLTLSRQHKPFEYSLAATALFRRLKRG
jgi:hypothetical protein